MKIFAIGSSIVSSYWNGAATYYRGIYKYLAARGHDITFAEPDAYGRQEHRDEGDYSYVKSIVYKPMIDVDAVIERAGEAEIVIKHSGIGVDDERLDAGVADLDQGNVKLFWDVDAPATIARIKRDARDTFRTAVTGYDAILTYGGGPAVKAAYESLGVKSYFTIYNGLDPDTHYRVPPDPSLSCDVAFLGNRLPDREARVDELFVRAAQLAPEKQFVLGGEGWADKSLPGNIRWIGHVPTSMHNRINSSAGMVMNINRESMAESGFSPPTRVFEVAGAGACLLCDDWPGLDDCFAPNTEVIVIQKAEDVVHALRHLGCADRRRVGNAFQARALRDHTYAQRAYLAEKAFETCIARKKEAELSRVIP